MSAFATSVLSAASTLPPEAQAVEEFLARLLSPEAQRGPIGDAMRYAVFGAAGRIRPILALRTGRIAGSPVALTVRASAAVELLHCASLIVDDLPCMDNDAERRGRPSVHIQFGEATAVLAAHSMVALAARSLVSRDVPAEYLHDMLRFQSKLLEALDANGLCGGQQMDLDGSASSARITELKTVPLFRLAVEAGAVGGKLWDQWRFPLRSFAREIGVVYQMTDDFLDGELDDRNALEEHYAIARQSLAPLGPVQAAPLLDLLEGLHARIPNAGQQQQQSPA